MGESQREKSEQSGLQGDKPSGRLRGSATEERINLGVDETHEWRRGVGLDIECVMLGGPCGIIVQAARFGDEAGEAVPPK